MRVRSRGKAGKLPLQGEVALEDQDAVGTKIKLFHSSLVKSFPEIYFAKVVEASFSVLVKNVK